MGDLRNKAKKRAEEDRRREAADRRDNGFTVFHFDFNPRLTRRNLTIGEAIRVLLRVTGTRIKWWRCPVRGLSIEIRELPRTGYAYDHGMTYRVMSFCDLAEEVEAKKMLALDLLLRDIALYRALPNKKFDSETRLVCELLTAPPSIEAAEWIRVKGLLDPRTQPLLDTHAADLRKHLLGQGPGNHTGTVALSATIGLAP